jgi:hypothetical protein
MELADLRRERVEIDKQDVWANERTPTPVRCFAVRLHSMGSSFREVEAVFDWLGVECCHQAVWYWKETLAETEFLVDAGGYLTAFARHEVSGHLDYEDRNHIEKWFQTITMRIDRFSLVLAGQSIKCKTLAAAVQTLLQPKSGQSSAKWKHASCGGEELDSADRPKQQ